MTTDSQRVTEQLAAGLRAALAEAGLPALGEHAWEVPREGAHGDYASNAAMVLAKAARRPPRQVAELIVRHFPRLPAVGTLEIAGPGFVNVTLAPDWCRGALPGIVAAGATYGGGEAGRDQHVRLEFVSANPTGPLVIVNARAAAVGDALARLLKSQGYAVTTEFYVNDAGNQFQALAKSFEARVRQALGEDAPLPENGYPGDYLVDLARDYVKEGRPAALDLPEGQRVEHLGAYAVARITEGQRRVLHDYGVDFDLWSSERRAVRDRGLPERVLGELTARGLTYEQDGALWFRASEFGDEKDRVLRKSDGELTYFAVDVAYHHYTKFGGATRVINLLGPDHHGYVTRMRAAMRALGHPGEAFDVLIIQLVTLLRDGQPVRMSKRRGEFVLMEELLEEVGRDAARFTFLTRRHDSPLEFDLALATRQSADNPVYYVQYAHARIMSLFRQAASQGAVPAPEWDRLDWSPSDPPRLTLPEELSLIKRLLQFPDLVAGAAQALEPHRIAYWLGELAGAFHPYYKVNRVIGDDVGLTRARLLLCAAVGQVIGNGLALLGVGAPESM
ncbi:MAG: arginine--tRNA ligase [Candidatus Rokuibacteriota bacterium]|nr:MAG: arginine--tRNA ligase [Candidatus Rokubacteria bacterium]